MKKSNLQKILILIGIALAVAIFLVFQLKLIPGDTAKMQGTGAKVLAQPDDKNE